MSQTDCYALIVWTLLPAVMENARMKVTMDKDTMDKARIRKDLLEKLYEILKEATKPLKERSGLPC